MRRKEWGFSLLEILAAMVVLVIVASIGMASYRGYQDRVAMMVDEANEKILQMAVRLYAYDNNALPGSLSELRGEDLKKAYAWMTQGRHPYTFLAFLQEWVGIREAAADSLPPRYFNNDLKVLICPSDPTPPLSVTDRAHRSYEIDPDAAGKSLAWLLAPDNSELPLIYECEDGTTEDRPRAYRHVGNDVCVITTVGGRADRKNRRDEDEERGGKHDNKGKGGKGRDGPRTSNEGDD